MRNRIATRPTEYPSAGTSRKSHNLSSLVYDDADAPVQLGMDLEGVA